MMLSIIELIIIKRWYCMNNPDLQKIADEFDSMDVEEYDELYNRVIGYNYKDIPVSSFKRLVSISKCSECPYLNETGEYMVTTRFECEKTGKSTSTYRHTSTPLEVHKELFDMFENCTFLSKE